MGRWTAFGQRKYQGLGRGDRCDQCDQPIARVDRDCRMYCVAHAVEAGIIPVGWDDLLPAPPTPVDSRLEAAVALYRSSTEKRSA